MKLYIWKDVERELRLKKLSWSDRILGVDVYPEELFVYSKEDKKDILSLLKRVLNCRINENDEIELEIVEQGLRVHVEIPDEETMSHI